MTQQQDEPRGRLSTPRPYLLVLVGLLIVACLVVGFVRLAAITQFLGLFPPAPEQEELTVSAAEDWQPTGLHIEPTNLVTIRHLEGAWTARPARTGAEEQAGAEGYVGEYRRDAPLPSAPVGALLGRIGSGAPFRIGRYAQFVSTESGVLSLRINDSTLDDNTGRLRVEIVIEVPTKEPLR
jgi:hypothetical protein